MPSCSSPVPPSSENGAAAAIPLTLSGMAHIPMGLPEGINGGLTQVLHHSLMSCLQFASVARAPFQWNVHDIATSPFAFHVETCDTEQQRVPDDLPDGFSHVYARHALIYLKSKKSSDDNALPSHEAELGCIRDPNGGWTSHESVLGCVSLYYATSEELTQEQIRELNRGGVEEKKKKKSAPAPPLPPAVLFRAVVESRSVPPTGSVVAVKAEIASMTTVGGSVDDDVKYGALEALHDRHGKYVLNIYSVRGKRYEFDLQDNKVDGKVKISSNMCVTVTNHDEFKSPPVEKATAEKDDEKKEESKSGKRKRGDDDSDDDDDDDDDDEYDDGEDILELSTKSRLCFSLKGSLHTEDLKTLPSMSFLAKELQQTFLALRPTPPHMAMALPSEQTLLLDPQEAGRVYLHGRYITTWGQNVSHNPALFGMDLIGIPYWHGQISDYDMLKRAYGQLWQDILIDARLMPMNIGGMLLSRLKTGLNPEKNDEDAEIVDAADDDEEVMDDDDMEEDPEPEPVVNPNLECLESQVMQSLKYDPVGISAKALATKFKMEYGADAFPCQAHEPEWVRSALPGWRSIVVPLRVIQVLRRGGYFDIQRSSDDIWFATSRQAKPGPESELVKAALAQLHQVGLPDLKATHVVFIGSLKLTDPIGTDGLVRFNRVMRQYHINEQLMTVDLSSVGGEAQRSDLLALEIAKCCPNRTVLTRYMLRSTSK